MIFLVCSCKCEHGFKTHIIKEQQHLFRFFFSLEECVSVCVCYSCLRSLSKLDSVQFSSIRSVICQISRLCHYKEFHNLKMHSITVFLASFLLCNFVTTFTIIQSDLVYNDIVDFLDNNDLSYENLEPTANNNILETMYAKQMVGKSHRFFFTTGERKDGKYQMKPGINVDF